MRPIGGARSARGIRDGIAEAVRAALAADAEALRAAGTQLAGQDQERLRIVQGHLVRELLETTHPDGLSGEDAQLVLTRCLRAAAGWYPELDISVLVVVLMGALTAHDPDSEVPPNPQPVAVHAAVLIADLLLQRAGVAAAELDRKELDALLDAAFAEIRRAETVELP